MFATRAQFLGCVEHRYPLRTPTELSPPATFGITMFVLAATSSAVLNIVPVPEPTATVLHEEPVVRGDHEVDESPILEMIEVAGVRELLDFDDRVDLDRQCLRINVDDLVAHLHFPDVLDSRRRDDARVRREAGIEDHLQTLGDDRGEVPLLLRSRLVLGELLVVAHPEVA